MGQPAYEITATLVGASYHDEYSALIVLIEFPAQREQLSGCRPDAQKFVLAPCSGGLERRGALERTF